MSLRLIAGRAGSGKTRFCLEEIKNAMAKDLKEPLILLVPEQFSLMAEKSLSAISEGKGIIRVFVLSFKRLAHMVFNETGSAGKPPINSAGKAVALYNALKKSEPRLEIFAHGAGKTGFIKTFADLISEFKRYGVTGTDIEEMLTRDHLKGSLLKQKLYEIGIIYDQYDGEIREKYIDGDDELNLLYNKLDDTDIFHGARIWIDQFFGFTLQELRVIEKLMVKAGEVNISLCMDRGSTDYELTEANLLNDVLAPSKITYQRLCNLALKHDIAIDEPVYLPEEGGRFSHSPMLSHLEKNIFSHPYKKYEKTSDEIKIFAARDIYSEIEYTARRIIALVRDKGLRYRDVTVMCSDLDSYERFVKALFKQYGIPTFIDKKRDILKHPVIMLILSVFDIFLYNWSYESVFRYLKTGLTGLSRQETDVLENYILACGIKGYKWTDERGFTYIPDIVGEGDDLSSYSHMLEEVNIVRRKVVMPLIRFKDSTDKNSGAGDICKALYKLLIEIGLAERVEEITEDFKDRGMLEHAAEYGQVFNIFIEALEVIYEMAGEGKIGLAGFKEMLSACLEEYKIGLIPPFVDQVMVGSTHRSINHNPGALFILGANEGLFPSMPRREGIINDKDRILLYTLGMELACDTKRKIFENQFESYMALTSASDHLTLSYPLSDTKGNTMRPSPIATRILEIFPSVTKETDLETNITRGLGEMEYICSKQGALSGLYKNLRRLKYGGEIHPLWYVVKEFFKDESEEIKGALNYTNQVSRIDDGIMAHIYTPPIHLSLSALERYSSCPFSFFAEYILKAGDRNIMDIYLPDIGTYLHTMLEELSLLFDLWAGDSSHGDLVERISGISDAAIDRMAGGPIKNGSARHRTLIKRMDRILARSVIFLLDHLNNSSFKPLAYEAVFGSRGGLPPICVPIDGDREIKLSGRIDRVDVFKDEDTTYTRVIDYKSGNKAFDLGRIYYGIDLQLITYLDAVSRAMGKGGVPAGMMYFKMDDPVIRTERGKDGAEIEKEIIKKMKMKGLVLNDPDIIRHMDHNISGTSAYLPVSLKKDNTVGANSKAATREQFEHLFAYVNRILGVLSTRMVSGDITIEPWKEGDIMPCRYCKYKPICAFDEAFDDNRPRLLVKLKDEKTWQLIYDELT